MLRTRFLEGKGHSVNAFGNQSILYLLSAPRLYGVLLRLKYPSELRLDTFDRGSGGFWYFIKPIRFGIC